jgi:hypothetical protein
MAEYVASEQVTFAALEGKESFLSSTTEFKRRGKIATFTVNLTLRAIDSSEHGNGPSRSTNC